MERQLQSLLLQRLILQILIQKLHQKLFQMEIVYVYQKKRSEFGKQALLSDRPAEVSLTISPDPAYMKNYVERNPTHTEIQATPDKSEHEV